MIFFLDRAPTVSSERTGMGRVTQDTFGAFFNRKRRIFRNFENSLLSVEIIALYGYYLDFSFEFKMGLNYWSVCTVPPHTKNAA